MDFDDIFLSIIIPTLSRRAELQNLLNSIAKSRIKCKYEVLVIDQNDDGLIDTLCDEYKERLNIIQHKVKFKGLSKAKNYGIKNSQGNIICFPDDDAEMLEDTVEKALNLLLKENADCVFGKCIDKESGRDTVIKFLKSDICLNLENFEGAFVEATMFAKKQVFDNNQYDEKMGVGSIFGSQEGYDIVYRFLRENKKMYYSPEILFYHPSKIETKTTDAEVKRAFYYSCGLGYLCKKHGFKKKYYSRLRKLQIGIPVIALIRHKELKYYRAQLMGLRLGYEYL